ncbi:MAG: TetR/AcrR family transcriptional regulator [Oscillospiraceae bacterium]|nr:TetR/AcrR family transcriptional regulator [Oscillospiraceae bacterium]
MRSTEQNKKERILETAQELFYRNGYDSTSVRELAKEAGLSVAGVYYFFSDKENILFTLLNRTVEQLNDSLKTGEPDGPDSGRTARVIIRNLLVHSIRNGKKLNVLDREVMRLTPEHAAKIRETRGFGRQIMIEALSAYCEQHAVADPDIYYAAFTAFSQTAWFTRWYAVTEDGLDVFVNRIFTMAVRALTVNAGRTE